MNRIRPFALLREGWQSIRHASLPLVTTMLAFQLLMLAVVSPVNAWLFREALRANGMVALDFSAMHFTGGIGISVILIVLIMLLAFWIAALQFIVLIVMLSQAQQRQPLSLRGVWREVRGVTRKLIRPSSLPLFFYLFLIVPLSGFGFASVLSQGIAVPSFISGELMKAPVSAAIWVGFVLLLALLNLRYALGLPLFVLTHATGGRALRQSWRLTRGWTAVCLALAVTVLLIAAALATLLLAGVTIVPTAIADAVAPDAAATIAAFSLGIAQLLGLALTAAVVMLIGALLLVLLAQREDQPAAGREPSAAAHSLGRASQQQPVPARRKLPWALAASCAVLTLGLGYYHLGTMQQLSQHPDTVVLGHRGFSDGGVENTLSGLEAAVQADADLVEIDVMQTADKKFVVMHDASLARLAGQDLLVKNLTLDELTAITVHDGFGHEDSIPSLEQYIRRAQELEMPLLIEVKSGGLDTPDRVPLLLAELADLGALDQNIFHTLDNPVVQELKTLHPDATVGYILAVAGVDIPATAADFVVVEQWSATQEIQDAAIRQGLGFFSWTVNEEPHMRELLRRNADGIITDHPDLAVAARADMQQQTGLAGTLVDALTRFVVVF